MKILNLNENNKKIKLERDYKNNILFGRVVENSSLSAEIIKFTLKFLS